MRLTSDGNIESLTGSGLEFARFDSEISGLAIFSDKLSSEHNIVATVSNNRSIGQEVDLRSGVSVVVGCDEIDKVNSGNSDLTSLSPGDTCGLVVMLRSIGEVGECEVGVEAVDTGL